VKKLLFETENEPMSAITHALGFLFAIAALVILVVFAAQRGTAWHVVGFSIFGASMLLLYGASTAYHLIPITHRAKRVMQRIDHAMIYVLIAGSYTPICFITLRGAWGWSLFGVVWGLAALGITWKAIGKWQNKIVSTVLYVLMGWLAMIALVPLLRATGWNGFFWLLLSGICYTVGAVIFGFGHVKWHPKWFGMHEVWHLFVMAGSFFHFWFLLKYAL
jgi:hemolysin III